MMSERGLELLEAHMRSLDPDAPTARERLQTELGEPFARELLQLLSREPPREFEPRVG